MIDVLSKLFGSPNRIKIIRFFLMNPGGIFPVSHISKSAQVSKSKINKELKLLRGVNFLKGGSKGKEKVFSLNTLFGYNRALKYLIVDSSPISRDLMLRRFRELGRGLKFVALSGIFVGDLSADEDRLDILLVGDNIRKGKLDKIFGKIESDVGREIKYVLFDTKEFKYRQSMYDKFVVDVLDGTHDVLIDSLRAGA